jgi:hypothetical protein
MRSNRSMSPITLPVPPSLRQIRNSGNRAGIFDHNQSTAANIAYAKNKEPRASLSTSDAVAGEVPEEPTCKHTTVPVS